MIIKTGEQVKLTKKKKRVKPDKKEVLTTPKKKSPPKSPPAINRKKTLKKKSNDNLQKKAQWGICINNKGKKILEARNAKCIFPFSYKNKEYNNCIDTDSEGGPWCATEISQKTKKMINYGYCPENERQKNYLSKILQSDKRDFNKSQQGEINMEELIKKMPRTSLGRNWIDLKLDKSNTKILIVNPEKVLFTIFELHKKNGVGKIIETFSISFDPSDAKKYIESPLKYNSIKVFITTSSRGKNVFKPFVKSYIWKFTNIYSKVNPNKLIADKIKLGYYPLPW